MLAIMNHGSYSLPSRRVKASHEHKCAAWAIYQQDNVRSHIARLCQRCLQGYDVLLWLAKLPNCSPIEPILDELERQRQLFIGELTAQFQRLSYDLQQEVIGDLINAMIRHVSALPHLAKRKLPLFI
ncbi:hypothetical protein TNCV_393261 [Trichonephila clavipes]|nr:hypothetical protein TNCV_393261 [Trichonephila clavipes]